MGKKSFSIGLDLDAQEIFGPLNETGTPERNLLMAVLVRAILDYVGNDKKEALLAEEWLRDELSSELLAPYSFQWICAQLDLDFKTIRERILNMPKRGEHRVAPWYFMKEEHQSRMAAKKAKVFQSTAHAQNACYEERLVASPTL